MKQLLFVANATLMLIAHMCMAQIAFADIKTNELSCLDKISLAVFATASATDLALEQDKVSEANELKAKGNDLMSSMQTYMFGLISSGDKEALEQIQTSNTPQAQDRFKRLAFEAKEKLKDGSATLITYTAPAEACLK